tara:strand:+ start:156 stop:560 length:405 start_codon:yes stop_codon:yes gene_type:complete
MKNTILTIAILISSLTLTAEETRNYIELSNYQPSLIIDSSYDSITNNSVFVIFVEGSKFGVAIDDVARFAANLKLCIESIESGVNVSTSVNNWDGVRVFCPEFSGKIYLTGTSQSGAFVLNADEALNLLSIINK